MDVGEINNDSVKRFLFHDTEMIVFCMLHFEYVPLYRVLLELYLFLLKFRYV